MGNNTNSLTCCSSAQLTVVYNFSEIEIILLAPFWDYVTRRWQHCSGISAWVESYSDLGKGRFSQVTIIARETCWWIQAKTCCQNMFIWTENFKVHWNRVSLLFWTSILNFFGYNFRFIAWTWFFKLFYLPNKL